MRRLQTVPKATGYASPTSINRPSEPRLHPIPQPPPPSSITARAGVPIPEADNHIPPAPIKRLALHHVARAGVPHALLGIEDGLRVVGDAGEVHERVVVRVVVAHVDGGALVAAHARAAAAAQLVADGGLLRVVRAEVLDAILDGVLVAMVVAADATEDVRLGVGLGIC